MMKQYGFGLGIVISAVVVAGLCGEGLAAAQGNYAGWTYGKAAARISSGGGTPVIASAVGDQLAIDDCVVTGSQSAPVLGSSGARSGHRVLLNLNCNVALAEPGKPGNSASSVEGRKAKEQLTSLAWYNKHPQNCSRQGTWCKTLCEKFADKCSAELLDYLGQ